MTYNIPSEDDEMFKLVTHNNIKGNPNSSTKQKEPKARYRGNYYTLDLKNIDPKMYNMYNEDKMRPFIKGYVELKNILDNLETMKTLRIPYDEMKRFIDSRFDDFDEENIRNYLRRMITLRLERVNMEIRRLLRINFKFIVTKQVRVLHELATHYHDMLNQMPYTDRELTMREDKKRIDKLGMIDTSHNEESDENENESEPESI